MTLYVQTRSVVFYDKKGVPQVYSPHFFFPNYLFTSLAISQD